MDNHYHLLIETVEGRLSQGMRHLNGVYSQHINRVHHRVGHLFQGRFKSILVQKESYLLELVRYIVLNPVRATRVTSAADWPWSSYRVTAGLSTTPEFVATDWLLSAFARERHLAQVAFAQFVAEGQGGSHPWQDVKYQIYLGSDQFVTEMPKQIGARQSLQDIPRLQTRSPARALADYADQYAERDRAMAEAYRSGAYSMREIGAFFAVGRMTVSRAVKKYEHT